MSWIDGPGYWRIFRTDKSVDAERIEADEHDRLVTEGSRDVMRVDENGYGYQNSGAALRVPGGVMPSGVLTLMWDRPK